MQIELRYFAALREALACSQESLSVPDAVRDVAGLRQLLRQRGAPWSAALAEGRALRVALNQVMCAADARLVDGCEVAFFPPVTGG